MPFKLCFWANFLGLSIHDFIFFATCWCYHPCLVFFLEATDDIQMTNQGGRGHWAVYYTSPQTFILLFSYSLAQQIWGLLLNFDWFVDWPLVVIYRWGNFVYHHLGCTSIYPFRSRWLITFSFLGFNVSSEFKFHNAWSKVFHWSWQVQPWKVVTKLYCLNY